MKRLSIFMPLVVLIFLSPSSDAQVSLEPCSLGITSSPLLMSCISAKNGAPLFYSIEINHIQPKFLCDIINSMQRASVTVTSENGDVVDQFLLKQYQYSFVVKPTGSTFQSYDKNLFLFDCMYYQGGGQGGFSVGN